MEKVLMLRLNKSYENVRKAFLDLDRDQDGFIDSEDLAQYMKNATSAGESDHSKGLNYTLLELMIKLRCKTKDTKINYNQFCSWLGTSIEPVEAFYFRHDSLKNP
mgnify:CR=1 FL=1|tara:strand:+ start:876 stop:1190 length:315 start_codon:yes stop_codon:yes gene_type:complete